MIYVVRDIIPVSMHVYVQCGLLQKAFVGSRAFSQTSRGTSVVELRGLVFYARIRLKAFASFLTGYLGHYDFSKL